MNCFNSLQVVQKPQQVIVFINEVSLFQFLIGSLETTIYFVFYNAIFGFQFLIGSLETLFFLLQYLCYTEVSIPYRQSRNAMVQQQDTGSSRFQFLIGSLETQSYLNMSIALVLFQFLIGSLETVHRCCRSCCIPYSFNSLQVVQKQIIGMNYPLKILSFNSLQVVQKPRFTSICIPSNPSFNSLQVVQKLSFSEFILSVSLSFNSLQVVQKPA